MAGCRRTISDDGVEDWLFAGEEVLSHYLFPVIAEPDELIFEEVDEGFLISVPG